MISVFWRWASTGPDVNSEPNINADVAFIFCAEKRNDFGILHFLEKMPEGVGQHSTQL